MKSKRNFNSMRTIFTRLNGLPVVITKAFLPGVFLVMLVACNDHSSGSKTDADSTFQSAHVDTVTVQPGSSVTNCYMYVLKRDTVLLQLQQKGKRITGVMSFDNYQKDSSHGDITGYVNGDTLYVMYDFMSEGMRSVMEIALLKSGNSLIRGVGPLTNKGDTVLYKDHQSIDYQAGQKLDPVDCSSISMPTP